MQYFPSHRPILIIFGHPFDEEEKTHALLGDECDIRFTEDVQAVLKTALESNSPKALLADSRLDDSVLTHLCRTLRDDYRTFTMPLLFYGQHKTEDLLRLYDMGATGHFNLPVSAELIALTVRAQLRLHGQIDLVKSIGDQLEETLNRRTQELISVQDVTILAMASLAETRDSETGNHIRRTQNYVRTLCNHLRGVRKFSAYLSDAMIDRLFKSAPLHDIGKVGIPDYILLKPGPLTSQEFEIMKTHTTLGKEAIEHAEENFGVRLKFLTAAKEIAYSHQEKWDGSGYPQGLKREEIPLSARLMAVADVYDALISRRVYKDPIPHAKAVEIIKNGRGSHFDPDLVEAFDCVSKEFEAIAERFQDTDKELEIKKKILEQMPS